MADRINHTAIKEARERLGFTQEEIADQLGVTKANVSHYETGVAVPSGDRLIKLCRLLKLKLADLETAEAA